jgi:hypothetical protein
MSADYCPVCGNILLSDRCSRCEANNFTRQRRWRKGDRGGKRPERRQKKRYLRGIIDGVWKNNRHHIIIHIDTEKGVYRSIHGRNRATCHAYQIKEEKQGSIFFYKDELLIEASVSDLGFLIMKAGDKRMSFAYADQEHLYRTCPICYGKSILEHNTCAHCWWEFESSSQ